MFIEHKKRRFYHYLAIFSIVFIVFMLLIGLFSKKRDFLTLERRNAKKLSNISILDIDFSDKIEAYIKDRFPFRDELLKIKGFVSNLSGNKYANGVYICKNKFYIEDEIIPDGDYLYEKTIGLRKLFINAKGQVDFFLFPDAYYIYNDMLPLYARKSEYERASYLLTNSYLDGKVLFHDMAEYVKKLKSNNYDIYYKTDHHMTSKAMYNLIPYIFKELGLANKELYISEKVTDNFRGSLLSKSGLYLPGVKDDIEIYVPNKKVRYVLTDYQNNIKKASIYDFDKIDSYDPYLLFLGGNSGYVNIKTENYMKKKLLVIKDSYFNSFLPFLLDDFGEIDIIDPRYIDKDIKNIVDVNEYENVMIFYNYNTFVTK